VKAALEEEDEEEDEEEPLLFKVCFLPPVADIQQRKKGLIFQPSAKETLYKKSWRGS